MTKYREPLRLKSLGFSERNIATSCGVSRNTVAKVTKREDELQLKWLYSISLGSKYEVKMRILDCFKTVSMSLKMKKLHKRISQKADIMDVVNKENKIEIISVKEFAKWYKSKIKVYEEIINEAEKHVGLNCVCEKGCSACCMQAIYINPAEYVIIEKYVEQLGYTEKENLKNRVREALEKIKKKDIPMKIVDGSKEEQDRISRMFFDCKIRCPFLSQDNQCSIYEIRPCVCWTYRNYKSQEECKKCFNPEHSCAFVRLDIVMTKEMYNQGSKFIKHKEYYLLIYAIAKILYVH